MAYLGAFNAMNTVSYLSKNKLIVYPNAIGFPQTAQADTLSMNNLIKYINGLINTVVTNSSLGVASDVWSYATRTLTSGTKDIEIDAIKSKTDKLKFNINNEVLSNATNTELQNLDVKISSRKPDVQDFTDDDRVKMQDIINNLNILLEIEQGDWEIKNNQMIFYSVYGYELMKFNLYNKDGLPSETNVYKRERI